MRGILFDVLEINIAVSLLILVLYFSAGKLRTRYGAAWMKTVWFLLAVRLLIPYNFSLPSVGIHLFNIPGFEAESMPADTTGVQTGIKEGESGDGANGDMDTAVYGENHTAGGVQELGSQTGLSGVNNILTGGIENAAGKDMGGEAGSADDTDNVNIADAAAKNMPEGGNTDRNGDDDLAVSNNTTEPDRMFSAIFNAGVMVKTWMIGGGIAFFYMAVSYIVFYRKYHKGLCRIRDKELYQKIAAIQKAQIGKVCIPVYVSRSIESPMLIGIFRPKLLLPFDRKKWNTMELELMMAHELCHYRKKDLVLKFVMMMVCCIHWFNPAVYLMKKQFFYEIELACDENVLRERGEKEKDIYARMILSFAGNKRESTAFSTGMRENKKRMKKRLSYMLDERRRKKGVLSIVIMVMAVLLTGFIVSCGYKPEEGNGEDGAEILGTEAEGNDSPDTELSEADRSGGNSEEDINSGNGNALQQEADFDYNHEYNEMLRSYGNDIFLAREDGIYYLKDGEGAETLLYENTYRFRRGMELYKNFLYFCGSVQRGEEEAATIYRMDLDTFEVEDALAMFSRTFDILYEVSIYEGNLYVSHQAMGKRIGFVLDENGLITGELDEEADDFLYREYNEYVELEFERINAGYDTEEYWELSEAVDSKYEAVMDVAACKKLLDGKQVVSRYKDEMLRSLYLENEDGTYEYLCDSVRLPVLITEDGMYYVVNEEADVWYIDFETKTPRLFYGSRTRELYSIYLINYDAEYVYLLKNRHIGFDAEDMSVDENFLLRVPRQGGEAEKVYQFAEILNLNMPFSLYRHCAVYDNRMFFDDLVKETISLNPSDNDMLKEGELSEDAAEMRRIAETFTDAYLGNDEEALRALLIGDFDGNIEFYPALPEQAAQVGKLYIGGLPEGNLSVGTRCFVSCEMGINPEADDILGYLTMEMVKTEAGFLVREYSFEG